MLRHDVPDELRHRPFTAAEGVALVGWPALRGPAYRRLLHGVYVVAGTGPDDHGTFVRGMRARSGGEPVLLGPSAAWALGARLATGTDPVHVAVASGRGPTRQAMVRPHRVDLRPSDIVRTELGAATTVQRTAVDLARGVGLPGASRSDRVAWVDAVLHATGTPAARITEAIGETAGLHGLDGARQVVSHVRDGAESVRETALRLLVVSRGLPEPVTQHVVRDEAGLVVARLDLAWPDRQVALEYDGALHRRPRRASRDMARLNRLRAQGWIVVQVDARALEAPEEFIAQLRLLLA